MSELRSEALDELDARRMDDEISQDKYMMERREIREKY